jgi:hypothetical protein
MTTPIRNTRTLPNRVLPEVPRSPVGPAAGLSVHGGREQDGAHDLGTKQNAQPERKLVGLAKRSPLRLAVVKLEPPSRASLRL